MIRLVALLGMLGLLSAPSTPAPRFELPDTRGSLINSDSLQGRVVLLAFWSTRCAGCKEEIAALARLHSHYAKAPVSVIAVNVDGSVEDVRRSLSKTPISFTVLLDIDGKAADAYVVTGLPVTFIIDKDGLIRHKHPGFSSESLTMYYREIDELLKQ